MAAGAPASGDGPAPTESGAGGGIPRLEFAIARLGATARFTFAFHAREVRFECDEGQGFASLFPETFSFRADRHDPSDQAWGLGRGSTRPPQTVGGQGQPVQGAPEHEVPCGAVPQPAE